jgi:hypothetical protein
MLDSLEVQVLFTKANSLAYRIPGGVKLQGVSAKGGRSPLARLRERSHTPYMWVRIRRFGGLSWMWVAGLSMQRVARELAEQHLQIQPYGPVFALFMEGNFEASVLLLDTLWNVSFAKHVRQEFVVAVPARDVLAFGDSSSAEAIAELNAITGQVQRQRPERPPVIPTTLPPRRGNVG